ncbi:MAG TPA: ABC transporter permease [Streptosporangiaceae bacterium]|nr:ABC transporter permease [Streptosporangiaceae bacterium]
MFLTYLGRELRRRARQASIIALGLALGIGLVITVTALSSGVKNAEGEVLHSLYGQDTDITVTKAPTVGSGASGAFGFRGAFGTAGRPAAGTTIDVDTLRSFGLGTLTSAELSSVSRLDNVAAAAGGLTLTDTKITGTIPAINTGGSGSGGFGGGGGFFNGSITPTSFSVDGVDLAKNAEGLGPLSLGTLTKGRTLNGSDAKSDVALVDANYAKSNKIALDSTVTIAKTSFTVVGIVSVPTSASSYDFYIPLARAQALSGMKNDVNTIYVAADSATNISTVSKAISKTLPGSSVQNSQNLASEITGSVSSASSLANSLGRWLAIAVLAVAFLLACLLTMAAVSHRVREFGTLKALGWTSRRIVRQVMGEALVIGVIGGIVGVGLGFLGSALAGHYYHTVTASLGSTTGSATPGGARFFGGGGSGTGGFPGGGGGFSGGGSGTGGSSAANRFRELAAAGSHTATVHLTPQITATVIVVAVLLAIAGGLLAGAFGGWRAAQLRPAAALARVE